MKKVLVLDIGGTAMKAAVMDAAGNILKREERETPRTSQQELLCAIEAIYREQEGSGLEGISLSMPGIIDSQCGYIYTGGALTYNCSSSFAGFVEERCGTKVFLENDGKCAALAELWRGSLKDAGSGIVLVLGTGVGGGIILNGELVKGSHFSAGEISYMCLEAGKFGQPEAMAGGSCGAFSLVQEAKEKFHLEHLDGRQFFSMLEKGAAGAEEILERYCRRVAVLVFNLQMVLDVQKISVGGGISRQPKLIECLKRQVGQLFSNEEIKKFSPDLPEPEIVACTYFNDSNLIGALYHYLCRTGTQGRFQARFPDTDRMQAEG